MKSDDKPKYQSRPLAALKPLPARARTAEALCPMPSTPPVRAAPAAVALPPARMLAPVTVAMPLTRMRRLGAPARRHLPQPHKQHTSVALTMPCVPRLVDLVIHCIKSINNVAVLALLPSRSTSRGLSPNRSRARSRLLPSYVFLPSGLSRMTSTTTEPNVRMST